jgi:DNA-binding NtrC family response regulator
MSAAHILFMDLNPHACPEGHYERLRTLLHSVAPPRALGIQTATRFPAENIPPPPVLIILRPSDTADLSEMVQLLRCRWNITPILALFCTGKNLPAVVCQCLPNDLDDFFTCPMREIDVRLRVQRFLPGKSGTGTTPPVENQAQCHMEGLVGKSAPFLRVLHMVQSIAYSDATVLITGETGTGKELVARAIHYQSPRRGKAFIPVNCGALPDHLFENELFGHAKGAYTDASSPEKGLIAEAEAGTLFLDEVDTLSASAQVKLLRFLQDREYRPLGCARSTTADVRIIAATNVDLRQQVQSKRFREDLYYRLNIVALCLPPLRERPEDIPLLADHFLCRYAHQYGRASLRLAAVARHKLAAYHWPGNVQELESVIQRAVILTSVPVLQSEDIDLPFSYQRAVSEPDSFHAAKARAIEQFERTI